LIGRRLAPVRDEHVGHGPKYLGLPGPRPLLGWEDAARDAGGPVTVVEGPLDWLALRSWEVAAVALCGARASPEALLGLRRFDRLYLALDDDDAGHAGARQLAEALDAKTVRLMLPDGVKDVAELAVRPDGQALFLAAVRAAEAAARLGS
jgi:DNA primase